MTALEIGNQTIDIQRPESVTRAELYEVHDEVVTQDIYGLKGFVEPSDDWLDIGCHVGLFSLQALAHGASTTFLVDEDHERMGAALENVLASADGAGATGGMAMRVETLAAVLDLRDRSGANCLKMDIQGSELEIFAEDEGVLAQRFDKLVMEWHPLGDTPTGLEEIRLTDLLEYRDWEVIAAEYHEDVLLGTETLIIKARSAHQAVKQVQIQQISANDLPMTRGDLRRIALAILEITDE